MTEILAKRLKGLEEELVRANQTVLRIQGGIITLREMLREAKEAKKSDVDPEANETPRVDV